MTELAPRHYPRENPVSQLAPLSRFSGQPILIAAAAFVVVVLGIGSIAGFGASIPATCPSPTVSLRSGNCRRVPRRRPNSWSRRPRASKPPGGIDRPIQVVQDQLLTVRRLLAAQQADTRKLSEQVGTLTESIDGLRQSFASAQASEPAATPSTRKRSVRKSHATKPRASKRALRRGRSNG